MLKIENLKVVYEKFEAIEDLSLEVHDGEFVAIIGSSGSGKSSLIKSINLLVKPKKGHIFIGKDDITLSNSRELKKLRREIGFIFQDYNLIDRLSVIENVLIGRLGYKSSFESLLGIFKKEEYKNAMDVLKKVSLEEKAFVRADELSGGQKQRVSIAKVIMQNPKLILADEPVASLDIATSENIMKYFEIINEKYKISIIINLHDVSLAKKYAKRIVALKEGKIIFDGKGSELTDDILRRIYT
ncbi:phosphonate ABC transporter ATP-binding protein [Fusobacterium sp. IOR10]|uniref:phosphonate ABC transporter ATP-binding protein n=1 Tax=Fusobacterium sp. IOR10 TaxID=2665157 RepID=UPI0013D89141|nr:phosphonate ABC transporter ATP-binding protein [Fusobacterium sp. IOR10]